MKESCWPVVAEYFASLSESVTTDNFSPGLVKRIHSWNTLVNMMTVKKIYRPLGGHGLFFGFVFCVQIPRVVSSAARHASLFTLTGI